MKIAIYQPRVSYYVGGGEVVPLEHAKHLSLRRHDVTLLTTRAPFIKESGLFVDFKKNNPKVNVQYIDVPTSLKRIYDVRPGLDWSRWHDESFHVGRLAQEWFGKNRFDVIALHNVVDSVAVPVGSKSVMHLHGYPRDLGDLQRVCLAIPDAYLAVSRFIKEKWLEFGVVKKCGIAHNGIDSEKFKMNDNGKIEFDVVYAGRLLPIKGVEYLLEAVAHLHDKGVVARTAIIGDGPDRGRLETIVNKYRIDNAVSFLGKVSDARLLEVYQRSKVAVLPSYDREGVLTTMLEAAACGLPTITTTACSMNEFLTDEVNGLLVKPKDSKLLAKAIKRMLTDDKFRRAMGIAARKKTEAAWPWKNQIIKVEKAYEQTSRTR